MINKEKIEAGPILFALVDRSCVELLRPIISSIYYSGKREVELMILGKELVASSIVDEKKEKLLEKDKKNLEEAREISKKLADTAILIKVEADESNKLYGSVGLQDIMKELSKKSSEIEKKHIQLAINSIKKIFGKKPLGWYTGRCSPNTRDLVIEEGGFLYDSDSYSDDLPYWETRGKKKTINNSLHSR